MPTNTRPSRQVERPERQDGSVAKCVAGTLVDELCELGRGGTFGTTPVAPRVAIGTVGDRDQRADDSGDDNADDNRAPTAPCKAGAAAQIDRQRKGCLLLGVKCATRSLRQEAVSSMVAPSAARCTASHPFLAAVLVS